jgi:DNA-binding HxlR family transcriptional regulator
VECQLTDWGQALFPVLDALLSWRESRDSEQPSVTELSHEAQYRRICKPLKFLLLSWDTQNK